MVGFDRADITHGRIGSGDGELSLPRYIRHEQFDDPLFAFILDRIRYPPQTVIQRRGITLDRRIKIFGIDDEVVEFERQMDGDRIVLHSPQA